MPYDFFDECPHRMAYSRCAFYRPKPSSQGQLLEARANVRRLKQEIPLTDDERAAVDDGLAALERLCTGLADVPTPAGPTPRWLRPADFDACWEVDGVDLTELDPVLMTFAQRRAAQKRKYGGELFPADWPADAHGTSFLDFFQRDRVSGRPKGIVTVDLGGLP